MSYVGNSLTSLMYITATANEAKHIIPKVSNRLGAALVGPWKVVKYAGVSRAAIMPPMKVAI